MDLQNAPENDTTRHEATGTAGSEAGTTDAVPASPDRFVIVPILRHLSARGEGSPPFLEIPSAEHDALLHAKSNVRAGMQMERSYWALVENYRDYEEELLKLALLKAVRSSFEWEAIQFESMGVDRRLMNLLSTARAYLDQLDSTFHRHFQEQQVALKAHRSAQYDTRLGYRVLEALRNVVQHSGRGVHGLTYPHDRHGEGLRLRVFPRLSVSVLRETSSRRQS